MHINTAKIFSTCHIVGNLLSRKDSQNVEKFVQHSDLQIWYALEHWSGKEMWLHRRP